MTTMSVTRQGAATSRNADLDPSARSLVTFRGGVRMFEVKCPGCPAGRRFLKHPSGIVTPWAGGHCTACHAHSHQACEACGQCLPEWRSRKQYSDRGRRGDRRYCSNACRQRAYRLRGAA